MAVAYRSSGASPAFPNPTAATSVTLTKPSGVVSGDILVAVLKLEVPTLKTISAPAGWTTLASMNAGSELAGYILWARAGGSEPASYTFSWTGGDAWVTGNVHAYSGAVASGSPWGGFGQNADFQTFIESVSYTTTGVGLGVWAHLSWADNAAPVPPAGYTGRGTSAWASITVADRSDSTTGAKTTGRGTTSAGGNQRYTFAGTLMPGSGGTTGVVINETFTGTDGTASSAFVAGLSGTGSSATIQTNTYRLRTVGGTAYDGAYAVSRKYTSDVADFDEIAELWNGDANEKTARLMYRGNTAFDGQSGYVLNISSSSPVLTRNTAYAGTTIGTASFTVPAVGTHYWVRVRAVGSAHQVKFWTGSLGAQPTTGGVDGNGWQIVATDATYSTGAWGFISQIGGASATRDFFIDNVSAVSGAGSGGPPTANAGLDQSGVNAFATVTLDGSGSLAAGGTVATYAWTQTVGPTVTLSSASAASPTFTAPGTQTGTTLTFSLIVTDDTATASAADTITITVDPATEFFPSGAAWVGLPQYQL